MKVRLGYVAIPVALNITSSSSVTYTHYQKLGERRGKEKIHQIILTNIKALKEILKYNVCNEITFFRMTCNLIPLGTHPNVDYEVWNHYQNEWDMIGTYINKNKMRVDLHPDQFCVLNSVNPSVIQNTIHTLKFYQKMLEAMHISGILILHIGSSVGGKKEAMKDSCKHFKHFLQNYNK